MGPIKHAWQGLKEEGEGRIRTRAKEEKVAGVAGGFFGAICVSGSYLHGRARSNEKMMRKGARRRERKNLKNLTAFSPRPRFRLSRDCISYLPTTKEKNRTKKKPRQLRKQGRSQLLD